MTTYTPNFTDPRSQRRARQALAFVQKVSKKLHKPTWLSCRWIHHRDNFGQAQNPLSQYLKTLLLICVDDRYDYTNTDPKLRICKKYIRNQEGITWLKQQLGMTTGPIPRTITEPQRQELQSGHFEFKDSSSRLYHPLQTIPREQKHQVLASYGYLYEYDIECCAPTLIYQYARKCGLDLYLFALEQYLQDRQSIRTRISRECEIPEHVVKQLIIILLNGGSIQINPEYPNDIYLLLKGDQAKLLWLRQDQYLCELRSDIKTCWQYIKPHLPRRTRTNQNGQVVNMRLCARRKTGLYRELERSVLDQIRQYLDQRSVRYFPEHDGFTCETPIDKEELINEILMKTGFLIKFDVNILVPQLNQEK